METLEIGAKVTIFEEEKEIDKGVIIDSYLSPRLKIETIVLQSLSLLPKSRFKFALMDTGWKLLFPDPMTMEESFSPKGPSYSIRPSA